MLYAQVHLTLPAWVHEAVNTSVDYAGDDAKVGLAIELSGLNVDLGTGGPFGAVVFDGNDRIVAVGVNRVVPHNCSAAHAEMMAYMTAQQRLQRFRLNEDGNRFILATSSQPCCQCYGAIVWAGIGELLIAARAEDTESLAGFDEGPLPVDWTGELERRGIRVLRDLRRDAACRVLDAYAARGGARY